MSPPVLFFDRSLPDGFDDLVAGRAIVAGPDNADLARADGVIAGSRQWARRRWTWRRAYG